MSAAAPGRSLQLDDSQPFDLDGSFTECKEYNYRPYQEWLIYYYGEGYYNIICKATGKALMVNYDKQLLPGQQIRQGYSYTNNYNQQWKIEFENSGDCIISNRATINDGGNLVISLRRTLGILGNNVYNDERDSEDTCRWTIEEVDRQSTSIDNRFVYKISDCEDSDSLTYYYNGTDKIGMGPDNYNCEKMWRFQLDGSGYYKIYTMWVQDSIVTNNIVLAWNNDGGVYSDFDSTNASSNILWKITKQDDYYLISPKDHPCLYLTKINNDVELKFYKGAESEWVISMFEYEASWDGGYYNFTPNSNNIIYCRVDNGFCEAAGISIESLRNAINEWNNISDNINLQLVDVGNVNYNNALITFKVEDSHTYAASAMEPLNSSYQYYSNSTEDAIGAVNSVWYGMHIIVYKTTIYGTSFTQLSDEMKYSTIVHELGHALKLSHVIDSYNNGHPRLNYLSIMQTQIFDNENNLVNENSRKNEITNFDKTALKMKWG